MGETPWFWIDFEGPGSALDRLAAELDATGTCGAQVLQEGKKAGRIRFWWPLDGQEETRRLRAQSAALAAGASLADTGLQEREDWLAEWRRHRRPLRASPRFLVCPPEALEDPPPGVDRIVLDHSMAFGSGHHATTRLCLGLLERHLERDERVVDVGAGSGILSVAAVLLGASKVLAVEIDRDAAPELLANLERNAVRDRVEVVVADCADLRIAEPRLVVANLILGRIRPLLEPLARITAYRPLLLSGIEEAEQHEGETMLRRAGFEILERRALEGWLGYACRSAG